MATTSIWSVKGWLGKVVIYIENPNKTENPDYVKNEELTEKDSQGLSDVIAYAVDCEKTKRWIEGDDSSLDDENEIVMKQYVSGINCAPSTARTEMMAVKKRYGKDEGIMAFHGYQSFAPGECTPQMAHEIGVKLAEELWGKRFQVLVATHLDKAHHLHNHFVVNSVSFTDGLRYHRTKQDYRDMREASDRLCREYGLSVIEHPKSGRAKHYAEWRTEQEGKPTYRGLIKADVDEAIRKAKTEKQFFHYLKEKEYEFKFGKDITIRPQGKERGLKLARNFGEEYTIEAIRKRILIEEEKTTNVSTQEKRTFAIRVNNPVGKTNFKPKRKIGGIRGLYLHYCYRLGILPKKRLPVSAKQMHILLREDLIKLDTITKETKLLCHYRIDTAEQLFLLQGKMQEELKQLSERRKRLRYQGRNIKDEKQRELLKKEIADISKKIAKAFIEDCDEVGYKELGGGVYALYSDIECTNELARVTTVKGDDVCLGTFPAGIYYLKQIKAPEGYVLKSEPEEYEIYAGRNKSTWMMNTEQKGSLYIYHEGEKLVGWDGTNFVYEMRNVGQNAIRLTAAEDIYSANGTLVYSKGDVVKERVEGNCFGSTSITGLTHGTYHVTELEDLEGYRKAEVSHTVTLEYDDTGIRESFTHLIIKNERQKASLTVCAEDSETAMKLTGGSYTLYAGRDIRNADGEVIVAQDTALETVQADENGDAIFTVDIPQNRDVYIAQTEAPSEYESNTTDKKSFYFNCLVYEDCEDVTVSYTFKNEKISEVPKQEPTETPKEEPKEEPTKTPTEKPMETPEEVPTEQSKEQPTDTVTTPKTGDNTNYFLWGGAGIMALVIILVVLKRKGILWK